MVKGMKEKNSEKKTADWIKSLPESEPIVISDEDDNGGSQTEEQLPDLDIKPSVSDIKPPPLEGADKTTSSETDAAEKEIKNVKRDPDQIKIKGMFNEFSYSNKAQLISYRTINVDI